MSSVWSPMCPSPASTFPDRPRSTALRRKPSRAIDRYASQKPGAPESVHGGGMAVAGEPRHRSGQFDDAILPVFPPTWSHGARPALSGYANSYHRRHPLSRQCTPPIPGCAQSATTSATSTDSPFSPGPIPPELAHLNVEPPQPEPDLQKPPPPPRPSREGTSTLPDRNRPVPVVRSDLPTLYTTHLKRTLSQDTPASAFSPGSKGRCGSSSSTPPSRDESSRIDSAISPPPSARRFHRRPTPDSSHVGHAAPLRKDSPAAGPAPSPAESPPFGIFSRKAQNVAKPAGKPARRPSKGPAAGTGHEGYGRFSNRGRNGSTSSSTGLRSPSTDSASSGAPCSARVVASSQIKTSRRSKHVTELDDFLSERLHPVTLRGSGCTFTTGTSSGPGVRLHIPSSKTSSFESHPHPQLLPSAMQSGGSLGIGKRPRSSRKNTSESSGDDMEPHRPTNKKWSFFRRTTTSPRHKGEGKAVDSPSVVDAPARQQSSQVVARYATMHPQTPLDPDEVQRPPSPSSPRSKHASHFGARHAPRILVQRQDSAATHEVLDAPTALPYQAVHMVDIENSPVQDHPNMLAVSQAHAPDMAASAGAGASDPSSYGTPEQGSDSPRQPRLSPLGRIPAVVSRRDRDRKLSDHSFSRPFARHRPRPSVKSSGPVYGQIRETANPIEGRPQPVSSPQTRPDRTSTGATSSNLTDPPHVSTHKTSMDVHNHRDLLVFPPRKNPAQPYPSGSTRPARPSWVNGLCPPPPQQEDVWDEYDDFLDQHMLLQKSKSGTALLGAPFQHPGCVRTDSGPAFLSQAPTSQPPTSELPLPPGADGNSTVLSVPRPISRLLQPSLTPITPDTLEAPIGGYGSRRASTLATANRPSTQTDPRAGVQYPLRSSIGRVHNSVVSSAGHGRASRHPRSASLTEARHSPASTAVPVGAERDGQRAGIVETSGEEFPSAHLRYSAWMTSRWLSFGRVLFSPAYDDVPRSRDPRVLIIDGLGSDWSYCVAVSYPMATVYNMGANLSAWPAQSWPANDAAAPRNHRQIALASLATSFPFPKAFFTAIILRYPIATTELAYAACISECKRVLRPGGFLEVAGLDLDLANMGRRARAAVRGLKTRLRQHDPGVCLQNLSDVLVRLVGRRGFAPVQRCVVGLPAAGRIPPRPDLLRRASPRSSTPSSPHAPTPSAPHPSTLAAPLPPADGRPDEPGRSSDPAITNTAAHVARWWHSACYEKSPLPTDRSIWTDPGLVRECRTHGTSFRLLICHAQNPLQHSLAGEP